MHALSPQLKHKAFTLIELLAAIAIIAALVTASLYFVGGYVQYAKQSADRQTLAVLNDALTRYKCEGGNVNSLTLGAPLGNIITRLKSAVTWAGKSHQFLQSAITYPARSLLATGSGAQYRFSQYNNYVGETLAAGTPNSTYQYGQGVGYMANGSAQAYNVTINTTSGFVAYKNAAGTTAQLAQGTFNIPASSSITFWSCAGISDASFSGSVTSLTCESDQLTSLDISGLTAVTSIDCAGNLIPYVNLSNHPSIISSSNLYDQNIPYTLNISGCTGITAIGFSWASPCTVFNASGSGMTSFSENYGGGQGHLITVDLSNCKNLTSVDLSENPTTSLNVSGCPALTSIIFQSQSMWSANQTTLNVKGCYALTSITAIGGISTNNPASIVSPWFGNVIFIGP